MNESKLEDLTIKISDKEIIKSEEQGWKRIQEIKEQFSPDLYYSIKVDSKKQVKERMTGIIHTTLSNLETLGLDVKNTEPGHGIGHLTRDYIHTQLLLNKLTADPADLLIGFIAGTLHDIGCGVVERYNDSVRAVRHPEAGALLLDYVFNNYPVDLTDAEKLAVLYSVAAHGHYTKVQDIKCADGITRTVEPYYKELDKNKKPLLGIWLSRWIDRLDCNGAAFVGRHYLTQVQTHTDYDGENFFEAKFEDHMRPLLRTKEEKGKDAQTMLEHIKMFADSQTNQSIYGKHDYGAMIELRGEQSQRIYNIVDAVQKGKELSEDNNFRIYAAWNRCLIDNIEPEKKAEPVTEKLSKMFIRLPKETQNAWCRGFLKTMEEYKQYAENTLEQINTHLDEKQRNLPTITDDVRKIIEPNNSWTDIIRYL